MEWYPSQSSPHFPERTRSTWVLDEPEDFRAEETSKLGVLEYILQPEMYPELYAGAYRKVRIN